MGGIEILILLTLIYIGYIIEHMVESIHSMADSVSMIEGTIKNTNKNSGPWTLPEDIEEGCGVWVQDENGGRWVKYDGQGKGNQGT